MRHLIFILISITLLSFFLPSCEKKEQVNIVFPDGRTYQGEWKKGNPNGQGTFSYPKLGIYVGEHKDGFPHGQGSFTWSNGRKYAGVFKEGKPNGQGTETFPDGYKYVGEYKDGVLWKGTEYDKNGNITGKWVNGVKQR